MVLDRVVGLGLCVLDELYEVDDFGLSAERVRYRARAALPGGMATTALAQAAALGCRAELLSLVGRDADGRAVVAELRRRGVGTRRLVRSATLPTTRALVLVQHGSGERRFVVPDRRGIERRAPDFDLRGIGPRTLLLVDGHFPRQAQRALRRARERGATVIADFADARPSKLRLLRDVQYAVLPESFVRDWGRGGPRATLRALHREFGTTPVLTLGARGALALLDGELHEIPPRRVRVRDTTGAGDVFHGAFAAGLVRGMAPLAALRLASRAAARSCTALGGMGALLEAGGAAPRARPRRTATARRR